MRDSDTLRESREFSEPIIELKREAGKEKSKRSISGRRIAVDQGHEAGSHTGEQGMDQRPEWLERWAQGDMWDQQDAGDNGRQVIPRPRWVS